MGGAAAAWWLSPLGTSPAAGGSNAEHESWSGLIGERFQLQDGATLVLEEATLREYRGDWRRPPEVRSAAISLLFSISGGAGLAEGIHTLTHPKVGRVRMYLDRTPRDEYPERTIFEAVLN